MCLSICLSFLIHPSTIHEKLMLQRKCRSKQIQSDQEAQYTKSGGRSCIVQRRPQVETMRKVRGKVTSKTYQPPMGLCLYFSLTFTNSSPHKSHFGNLSFKVRKDINDFSYLHLKGVIFHLVKCACVCQESCALTYITLSSFKDSVCLLVCI